MAENEKGIRLSKAAKELSVAVSTIVDFLNSKGIKIENNPNAKLSEEAHTILLKEYQADKTAKEEAIQVTKSKLSKETSVVVNAEESHKNSPKDDNESDEILIKNAGISKKESKKTAEVPVTPAPPTIEVPAEKEIVEPEIIKPKREPVGLNIIGKIDLEPKGKTGKKEKTQKEKEKEEEDLKEAEKVKKSGSTAKKAEEIPGEEKVVAIVAEKPVEEKPQEPVPALPEVVAPPEKDEIYRRDINKIAGPNIIGKIELPTIPKKGKYQPPAGPINKDDKKKRKRKTTIAGSSSSTTPTTNPKFQRPGQGPGQGQSRPFDKNKRFERKPDVPKPELTDKDIQDQIKQTLAKLSGVGKSKGVKHKKAKRDSASQMASERHAEHELNKKTIQVTEFVSANELAKMMNVQVTDVISTCMSLGIFVSINQRLDAETLSVVADEFGYKVEFITADAQDTVDEGHDNPEDLMPRPAIITVMGHVDHGKTSLLDYIRKANVIAGEAGGITQHIGAYEVTLESGKHITFLDTPGHEAFTAMRARGAKVTDIAIIVIAADDSVMPQTIEAINHALAANVKIVFAINKIDKPGANPTKIKEQLANMNLMTTDWGGKYEFEEISAKKGINVDSLLEKVLLEADILDLKANPNKRAVGTVIESSLDKGRGYITTVLVQSGTLNVGDIVLAGCFSGKVKALFNERGVKIKQAGPSQPALLLGMNGAPQAGDKFNGMEDERSAREIANKRMQLQREQGIRTHKHITLDEIGRRLAIGNFKELNIIVKGDVDGSIEALGDALLKLSTTEIQVNVIHKSVGQISESDVLLASASEAIIIGFQVRPSMNARKLAEHEQIDIRLYSIIYDAINEIKAAMEGMLAPEYEEKIVCNIEIRDVFKIPKVGSVAGCMVLDGKVTRNTRIRVVRDGIVVFTGELASLKRFKDDVKEVAAGYECGLNINNFNDIKVSDIIEGYESVAVKRTLA
ncbi:MAG: translation initiation factor IF-2 [Bacteroidota bacterium]